MTLSSLEVELATCFESGQAYVALSRAVSLTSTRIFSFDPRRVTANRKVKDFYREIEALQRHSADEGGSGAAGEACDGAGGEAAPAAAPAPASAPPGLSAEQRARIEANRAAALARRRLAQK